MDIKLIGEQISLLRKQTGMTQEELGRAVGVSTQAVSRWECGGAPDTALLPAIADALHTSIDALFARDSSGPLDPAAFLYGWLTSMPEEQRWERLAALLTQVVMRVSLKIPDLDVAPMPSCEGEVGGEPGIFLSFGSTDSALFVASYAKDMTYCSLYPEPEKGYAAYFADCDTYRKFFSMLAMPNCLELLLDLLAEPANGEMQTFYFSVASAAQRLGISEADAAAVIQALSEAKFLEETTVELGSESVRVYGFDPRLDFISLMYTARYLAQYPYANYINCRARKKPYLRKPMKNNTGKDETK